jgi:hypothetical protein
MSTSASSPAPAARVPFRNGSAAGPTCAAPDCSEPVLPAATGRPARFCSPACRARAHRAQRRASQLPVSVEVDMGSVSSRGRPQDRAWMVRLRRGERSVIVAIGLRRPDAERLAAKIADLLGDNPPRLETP